MKSLGFNGTQGIFFPQPQITFLVERGGGGGGMCWILEGQQTGCLSF